MTFSFSKQQQNRNAVLSAACHCGSRTVSSPRSWLEGSKCSSMVPLALSLCRGGRPQSCAGFHSASVPLPVLCSHICTPTAHRARSSELPWHLVMALLWHLPHGVRPVQTRVPVPAAPRWEAQASPYTHGLQDWGRIQPAGRLSAGIPLHRTEGGPLRKQVGWEQHLIDGELASRGPYVAPGMEAVPGEAQVAPAGLRLCLLRTPDPCHGTFPHPSNTERCHTGSTPNLQIQGAPEWLGG